MIRAEEAVHKKGSLTHEQAELLRSIRIARAKVKRRKGGRIRAKLEGPLRQEVERLINEDNLSYRQTARYLKEHHKVRVSPSYLCEILKEWGAHE